MWRWISYWILAQRHAGGAYLRYAPSLLSRSEVSRKILPPDRQYTCTGRRLRTVEWLLLVTTTFPLYKNLTAIYVD